MGKTQVRPKSRQVVQIGRPPEHPNFRRRHSSQDAAGRFTLGFSLDAASALLTPSCSVRGIVGAEGSTRPQNFASLLDMVALSGSIHVIGCTEVCIYNESRNIWKEKKQDNQEWHLISCKSNLLAVLMFEYHSPARGPPQPSTTNPHYPTVTNYTFLSCNSHLPPQPPQCPNPAGQTPKTTPPSTRNSKPRKKRNAARKPKKPACKNSNNHNHNHSPSDRGFRPRPKPKQKPMHP